MATKLDILCFSSGYWDEPLWTNKQHVMSRLAKDHRVLYVEPSLSITGCLRGWNRLQHPWRRLLPWIRQAAPNLYLYYLPCLPGNRHPFIRRFNRWLQGWALNWMRHFLHVDNPLLWFYRPEDVHVLDHLTARFVCYDCVDEMAEFPVHASAHEKQQSFVDEQVLLHRADLVFTTSPHLYETKKRSNPHTYYVPNVADIDHFSRARDRAIPIPADLATIPSPIIGFVGAVSAYKIDLALLQQLAATHPEWQIVLIGPIGIGESHSESISHLSKYPNIHLLGSKPYATLPNYLKGFEVCLIPYCLNEYTQGVFPMKFYEYLATGKPIVTTALPALLEFDGLVKIAHSHEEFITAIEQVLRDDPNQEERLKAAEGHTWEARTNRMLELIAERLRAKQGASQS